MFNKLANTIIRIATFANMAGAIVLFALVAIMNADVFARGVLHAPIKGVVELVIFALVLIVFLQLPDVVQGKPPDPFRWFSDVSITLQASGLRGLEPEH